MRQLIPVFKLANFSKLELMSILENYYEKQHLGYLLIFYYFVFYWVSVSLTKLNRYIICYELVNILDVGNGV